MCADGVDGMRLLFESNIAEPIGLVYSGSYEAGIISGEVEIDNSFWQVMENDPMHTQYHIEPCFLVNTFEWIYDENAQNPIRYITMLDMVSFNLTAYPIDKTYSPIVCAIERI